MAISYGFYDSKNGDRKYTSRQISQLFNALIKDGVFQHVGNHLAVKQNSGMTLSVSAGLAWFNSTWTLNDGDEPVTIPDADLLFPRIDAVILEVNETNTVRENSIKIIKGTPASSPQKPSLTNDADIHQHALAYVTVGVGVTSITNANIENRIGLSDCPYVSGILSTVSADTFFQKWDAEFSEWFEKLSYTLSDDVAGNLYQQIQGQDYLYAASFRHSSWVTADSSAQAQGFLYAQTVSVESKSGGPGITSSSKMTSGIMIDDGYPVSTFEILEEAATIINKGKKTFSTGSMTVYTSEKPTADVRVFFTAMKGV